MQSEDIKYLKLHKTNIGVDMLKEMEVTYKLKLGPTREVWELTHPEMEGHLVLGFNPTAYTTFYTAKKFAEAGDIIKKGEDGFFYLSKRGGEDV